MLQERHRLPWPETVILASDFTSSEALPKAMLVFATLNKGISVALSPIAMTLSREIENFFIILVKPAPLSTP